MQQWVVKRKSEASLHAHGDESRGSGIFAGIDVRTNRFLVKQEKRGS